MKIRSLMSALVVSALVIGSSPEPASATSVVCAVNSGGVNGSDSLGGTFPGSEDPDGGLFDASPLLNYVETKITWGDKLYGLQNYDVIGHWRKKVANNR